MSQQHDRSFLMRIVEGFLRGNLPVLIMLGALIAGALALTVTPREEEPQISVPLADILISYPGGSPEQIERLVSSRLERLLYQVDGVEYVYSMSRPGQAIVTVRFFVGEDRDISLLKLYNQLHQNLDQVTPGITSWIMKPVLIDDVPIVNATLYSASLDSHVLYRVAEEVAARLQRIENSARITIHGGEPRTITAYLDPDRVAAYGLSIPAIQNVLRAANVRRPAGTFEQNNEIIEVMAGPFLRSHEEVRNLIVGVFADQPVYLRDIADVLDTPREVNTLSRFSTGPADARIIRNASAVTVAVAKKRGSNAVRIARQVQEQLDEIKDTLLPPDVGIEITRDYGQTANQKVNDLVGSLGLAIITVIGLLTLTMNWRAGLIVAIAVPITYSLTLLSNYLLGYTINRVTLFALILALGLVVDDPIAGVENIERHLKGARQSLLKAVAEAMREIMVPILMSTLAIIIAFIPMFFITGMMGPYMQPMALNVPLAVIMSTITALTVTPWLAAKILPTGRNPDPKTPQTDIHDTALYRVYKKVVAPFIDSRRKSRILLTVMTVLFFGAVAMALTGLVPLKMLPFDNKNEFQILVDMPEGTTLEHTDSVIRDISRFLQTIPEVRNITTMTGGASPMDFNGMVRQYYMRQAPHMGDIRVNLLHRTRREMDSHALTLRIRDKMAAIGKQHGANLKLVEIPPGPPVFATLVAEVYGSAHHTYADITAAARTVHARMQTEPGVVDLDSTMEAPRKQLEFVTDREKAGRNGIQTRDIAQTLQMALAGTQVGIIATDSTRNELPIRLRLPRNLRSAPEQLEALPIAGATGHTVRLGELGQFTEKTVPQTIYRKNQKRVVYVHSEVAGLGPAYPVLNLQSYFAENPLPEGFHVDWRGEGEWKITLDVFRDLGIAFSVALLGIYVLLVYETGTFLLPVVIMLSIPLTLIGIMPGFWLLNLLVNRPVGGFENPVFFTATAMIGMIALSGIVVRNAIVLIDFIRQARDRGDPLRDSILASGAVRMRPILLTAGTTMLGAWPITFDPIFSGLAWSIIFGLFVSTIFTLVVIPVVYNLLFQDEAKPGGEPSPEP